MAEWGLVHRGRGEEGGAGLGRSFCGRAGGWSDPKQADRILALKTPKLVRGLEGRDLPQQKALGAWSCQERAGPRGLAPAPFPRPGPSLSCCLPPVTRAPSGRVLSGGLPEGWTRIQAKGHGQTFTAVGCNLYSESDPDESLYFVTSMYKVASKAGLERRNARASEILKYPLCLACSVLTHTKTWERYVDSIVRQMLRIIRLIFQ